MNVHPLSVQVTEFFETTGWGEPTDFDLTPTEPAVFDPTQYFPNDGRFNPIMPMEIEL